MTVCAGITEGVTLVCPALASAGVTAIAVEEPTAAATAGVVVGYGNLVDSAVTTLRVFWPEMPGRAPRRFRKRWAAQSAG